MRMGKTTDEVNKTELSDEMTRKRPSRFPPTNFSHFFLAFFFFPPIPLQHLTGRQGGHVPPDN